jgi:hypothetical protein
MKKVLTALITVATMAGAMATMSSPADARWAGGVYRGWGGTYYGWRYRAFDYRGSGYRVWAYRGSGPRVVAVAGAIIGGALVPPYYPVGYYGYYEYSAHYGPTIYGPGFCVLTAYYGWAGGCF